MAPETSIQAGSMLGPYELRGELGRGAMARVWRAWDPKLEREVAIKEPLFDSGLSGTVRDEMGRRFVAEARAAAKLNHANIVTIYTADVFDGRPAIVMELVDGTTLSELLRKGPLAPAEALSVLDQLLDAVGYAHEMGIVHRDIKPDNVFVTKRGEVKLADFGIARQEGAYTQATVAGAVLGTPGYMSPEQAKGAAVDGRSDLFSVGVLGYELLSGKNPFGAGDGSDATTLLYRIVHEPAPEIPARAAAGLPSDIRPTIMAALEKDPIDRPQTAEQFKAMLHGGATLRRPAPKPAAKTTRDLPRWLPYAVVAVLALGILGGMLFSANNGSRGSAPAPTQAPAASDQAGEQTTDASAAPAAEPSAAQPAEQGQAADAAGSQAAPVAAKPAGPAVKAALADYSWEELGLISQEIKAVGSRLDALSVAAKYNLVSANGSFFDTVKPLVLTDGTVVNMRLVDVAHDELADGSGVAGLTFMAANAALHAQQSGGTTMPGGWEGSALRSVLNSSTLDLLPMDARSVIVPVRKYSNNVGEGLDTANVWSTVDTLWAPSIVEVAGRVDNWKYHTDQSAYTREVANAIFNAEGTQYAFFTQQGVNNEGDNRCLALGEEWALRSSAATTGRGRRVSASGDPSEFGDSNDTLGVVFGFCI